MSFTLEKVVPWGRSYEEYRSMFSLSDSDLQKRIIGCGDGPSEFNAELTRRGGRIISVDPIYHFSAEDIQKRIDATYETVLEQTRENQNEFTWKHINSVDELGKTRMRAMRRFIEDYPKSKNSRYVVGELPSLKFADNEFDLALCSHFLFLYSDHFSLEFHVRSIIELCRVAREVRIFPLLELGARKSRHFRETVKKLSDLSYTCSVEKVAYEFQKGGNEMLRAIRDDNI